MYKDQYMGHGLTLSLCACVYTKLTFYVAVMLEAQKCLCNIIFNSPAAQRVCR